MENLRLIPSIRLIARAGPGSDEEELIEHVGGLQSNSGRSEFVVQDEEEMRSDDVPPDAWIAVRESLDVQQRDHSEFRQTKRSLSLFLLIAESAIATTTTSRVATYESSESTDTASATTGRTLERTHHPRERSCGFDHLSVRRHCESNHFPVQSTQRSDEPLERLVVERPRDLEQLGDAVLNRLFVRFGRCGRRRRSRGSGFLVGLRAEDEIGILERFEDGKPDRIETSREILRNAEESFETGVVASAQSDR